MNDNDLERRLRAETGPRERGYVPAQLPASPESPPSPSRPTRIVRVAVLVGAVAAGALAVAVASALINGNAPEGGVGVGGTPTPTASGSPHQPTDCQPVDVALTAEPWGGAAGSRGTVVTVALADGRYPCVIQRHVGATVADADGENLVAAYVRMIYEPVVLSPGERYTVGVTWSNWCGGDVVEPVSLALESGGVGFPVDVPGGADPVPPCLGENAPSALNTTGLQPAE